jgi:diguanylate cyclase (GGDEF)-like protein
MADERIRQLEAELEQLRTIVYFDELTRLLNRRGFIDRVEQIFQFIRQHHSTERRHGLRIPFSVIFIDVDNFKNVNDTYGHAVGDAALKHVAQTLSGLVRQGDVLARFGGEEFVIALHALTANAARHVGEKLRAALAATPCVYEHGTLNLTASFGVAEYRAEDASLDALIHRADEAMYQAKQQGKNRVVVAPEL